MDCLLELAATVAELPLAATIPTPSGAPLPDPAAPARRSDERLSRPRLDAKPNAYPGPGIDTRAWPGEAWG